MALPDVVDTAATTAKRTAIVLLLLSEVSTLR